MQRLEPAVVFQRFAPAGAEAVEIDLLRIAAAIEILEQLPQQALTAERHGRPVDQLQLLQTLPLAAQIAGLDA